MSIGEKKFTFESKIGSLLVIETHHIQTAAEYISKHQPKESDSAPGGGNHGTVVSNSVFSRDVVLQEQTLGILLLQSVPLSCILLGAKNPKD